jgi:membrane protease subunit (stomatin/prohibitin family)
MPILNVIEHFDDDDHRGVIVHKEPQGPKSGEYSLGSQLIVQESQTAFFFRDGQALDGFEAGRHTLSTQNLPLLKDIIGLPFGKSPFRCYVYFVSTKTFTDLGWGTQAPVMFRDTDFRMISIRAHGAFSIRIVKPRIFLNTIVGTRGLEYTYHLENFLKAIIVSRFNEVLGTTIKSILDLPTQYSNIALKTKEAVFADFDQYGIQLVDLFIQAITPPIEVQKMINTASGVAVQDTEKYKAIRAADAMVDAANNPNGTASQGLGAGVGLGLGLGMAQQMMQNSTKSQNTEGGASPKLSPSDLKTKLTELKKFKDDGLINDSDFEETKRRLLSLM